MTLTRIKFLAPLLAVGLSSFAATAASAKPLPHPTRPQFITEADKVCGVYQRKDAPLQSKLQSLSSPQTAAQLTKLEQTLGSTAQLSRAEVKALRALPEPASDQAVLSELWSARLQGDNDLMKIAQAFRAGSKPRVTSASKAFQAESVLATHIVQRYGFKVCGATQG